MSTSSEITWVQLHGCQELLGPVRDTHSMATSAACTPMLSVPITRLKLTVNDFAVVGPIIWNQVPQEVHQATSLNEFKTEIKRITFHR